MLGDDCIQISLAIIKADVRRRTGQSVFFQSLGHILYRDARADSRNLHCLIADRTELAEGFQQSLSILRELTDGKHLRTQLRHTFMPLSL